MPLAGLNSYCGSKQGNKQSTKNGAEHDANVHKAREHPRGGDTVKSDRWFRSGGLRPPKMYDAQREPLQFLQLNVGR